MRYTPEHREETRRRILEAAGRGFRKHGYAGIGVDGLAKEAGVTSGAFYAHFSSKGEAFTHAVTDGIRELATGIEQFQREHGAKWLDKLIDFYLSTKRTCGLDEACAIQALTPEVMRADAGVRSVYESEILNVIEALARGLQHGSLIERRARSWALLSLLSGAVSTTRALNSPALANQVAKSVRSAALALANPPQA
ncbi:MAG TPA: TetR/AcrR family transcriptional regulator [Hydrogenophaga sp.]